MTKITPGVTDKSRFFTQINKVSQCLLNTEHHTEGTNLRLVPTLKELIIQLRGSRHLERRNHIPSKRLQKIQETVTSTVSAGWSKRHLDSIFQAEDKTLKCVNKQRYIGVRGDWRKGNYKKKEEKRFLGLGLVSKWMKQN